MILIHVYRCVCPQLQLVVPRLSRHLISSLLDSSSVLPPDQETVSDPPGPGPGPLDGSSALGPEQRISPLPEDPAGPRSVSAGAD